jgi:hypothetical protein
LRVAQFGLSFDELFAGIVDTDEFDHVKEPSSAASERYVAPSEPRAKSHLIGAPVAKPHPALR